MTSLTLYCPLSIRLTVSSSASRSLLVVANSQKLYPFILKYITSKEKSPEVVSLVDNKDKKDYGDENGCVAYSTIPDVHIALIIPVKGPVKLINCSPPGKRRWTVERMANETMDTKLPWIDCSLRISNDGLVGLALDRRGKLVLVKFILQ